MQKWSLSLIGCGFGSAFGAFIAWDILASTSITWVIIASSAFIGIFFANIIPISREKNEGELNEYTDWIPKFLKLTGLIISLLILVISSIALFDSVYLYHPAILVVPIFFLAVWMLGLIYELLIEEEFEHNLYAIIIGFITVISLFVLALYLFDFISLNVELELAKMSPYVVVGLLVINILALLISPYVTDQKSLLGVFTDDSNNVIQFLVLTLIAIMLSLYASYVFFPEVIASQSLGPIFCSLLIINILATAILIISDRSSLDGKTFVFVLLAEASLFLASSLHQTVMLIALKDFFINPTLIMAFVSIGLVSCTTNLACNNKLSEHFTDIADVFPCMSEHQGGPEHSDLHELR